MALRNIVEEGDEILRKTAREIKEIDHRVKVLAEDMVETMIEGRGVGIAAPQVGVLKRMFVAIPYTGEDETPMVFINPEILQEEGTQQGEEGCLSVPGYVGTVTRPLSITLKALDLDGVEHRYQFTDFAAVVVCHEFDHLNGVLYTDKAESIHEIVSEPTEEAAQ